MNIHVSIVVWEKFGRITIQIAKNPMFYNYTYASKYLYARKCMWIDINMLTCFCIHSYRYALVYVVYAEAHNIDTHIILQLNQW